MATGGRELSFTQVLAWGLGGVVWLHPAGADGDVTGIACCTHHTPPGLMRRCAMLAGNYEPTSRMCLYNEAFKTVVAGAQGFELVNEGTEEKPKWGYVGNTTGSVLHLRLNTQLTAKGDQKTPVTVLLAHLRSYEHMGSAEIK